MTTTLSTQETRTPNGADIRAEDLPRIARLIAFYLPQFHPIPENDTWWGKGFTEWTNVTRTQALLPRHYQPRLPADLGFYDLRVPETREEQAHLARQYGIYGFCYYHYWFSGRRFMEHPFNEVLASGKPDFPFCLCWANGSFTRAWSGDQGEVLLAQEYSPEDDIVHIRSLLPAFDDPRYIRVEGRPLLLIYSATSLPDPAGTTHRWRTEVQRAGFPDLFLLRVESYHDPQPGDPRPLGFDSAVRFVPSGEVPSPPVYKTRRWELLRRLGVISPMYNVHTIYDYADYSKKAGATTITSYPRLPCVMPSWDNSPRRKSGATIFLNSTPDLYAGWLETTIRQAREAAQGVIPETESPIVFINAWNEWAEGAYLEPDQQWGHRYLAATRQALVANAECIGQAAPKGRI